MNNALTDDQKEGALLFFGAAKCVSVTAYPGRRTRCSAILPHTSSVSHKSLRCLAMWPSMGLAAMKTSGYEWRTLSLAAHP